MSRVLMIEASATRRRALSSMLAAKGFEVQVLATYSDGLQALTQQRDSYRAVVLSWPEYSDHRADEVFTLLRARDWQPLPTLVLADSTDAGAVNWLMKRPAAALLLWGDYSDAPEALHKLIHPSKPEAAAANADSGQLKILFVDDSPTVRVAFRRLLLSEGYGVEVASTAEEGYDKACAQAFDIAIIDYFMPGDNGSVLVKRLRENPKTASMLSAIITGTYADRVITESLSAGAVECMFKSEARELFLARMKSLARTILDRKAIDNERRRLHGILNSVGDGVYGVDAGGVIQFINPAALDILGKIADAPVVGQNAAELFHYAFEDGTRIPRQACFLSQCYRDGTQIGGWQTVFWTDSGRPLAVECTVYPMDIEGRRVGSVVAFRDVSERRRLEDELRWQASHDALTKLHNRAHFERQLEQEVARLRRSDNISLLLFVDVDRFKYINDTAGHSAGDQLLVEASQRLKSRLRGSDTLARMGGDEYALILRNVGSNDPERLADEFRRALTAQPFVYGDKSYRITASIGVTKLDRHTVSPSEAMAAADIACHLAKNSGRNQTHLYSPEVDQRASMDLELNWSARLEEALRGDQFVLVYQPILPVDGIDFEVALPDEEGLLLGRHLARSPDRRVSYEVLLRMRSSDGEFVAPDAFLPTAERYNLMLDVDRWVIHHAFKALRESAGGPSPIGLSINLSSQSLTSGVIAKYVTGKLIEFDIDPSLITFEITETKAVSNLDAAGSLISELRALGCRFALDDFGCGFSSFTHLKNLDVDFLKIDGLFTQGILDDHIDRAVIEAINRIAHSVGKKTVAEYVDRPGLIDALRVAGVDYLQGYYVGRPQPSLARPRAVAVLPISAALETPPAAPLWLRAAP
jgi:diguanylate cyclase (GGDEF)-like protein/PAS domain S-box-containing protein